MPSAMNMATHASRHTRARSPSPPPERNVRPKLKHRARDVGDEEQDAVAKASARPVAPQTSQAAPTKDTRLALAHLLYDKPEHPLYSENLNGVLDGLSERADLTTALKVPFDTLMAAEVMQIHRNEEKKKAVTSMVKKAWLKRILSHVGQMMDATADGYVQVEKEMSHYHLELKVSRIFHVDDVASVADGPDGAMDENEEESEEEEGEDGQEDVEDESGYESNDGSASANHDEHAVGDSGTDCESLANTTPRRRLSQPQPDVQSVAPASTGPAGVVLISDAPVRNAAKRDRNDLGPSNSDGGSFRPRGLKVHRYAQAQSANNKLLLREPVFPGKNRKRLVFPQPEVAAAMRILPGSSLHLNPQWSLTRHCRGHWRINLASPQDAAYFAGKYVNIRGHHLRLAPFRTLRSQVFVCNHIPEDLDLKRTLQNLTAVFPDRGVFVTKSQPSKRKGKQVYLVVTLDRSVDAESFKFKAQRRSGKGWNASFIAWDEASKCHICGHKHQVYRCPQLAPVHPQGQRLPKLLTIRPDVSTRLGGS